MISEKTYTLSEIKEALINAGIRAKYMHDNIFKALENLNNVPVKLSVSEESEETIRRR